jgi:hypothetical protein
MGIRCIQRVLVVKGNQPASTVILVVLNWIQMDSTVNVCHGNQLDSNVSNWNQLDSTVTVGNGNQLDSMVSNWNQVDSTRNVCNGNQVYSTCTCSQREPTVFSWNQL